MCGAHLRHFIFASAAAAFAVVALSCGASKPTCEAPHECAVSCESTQIVQSDCVEPCPSTLVDLSTCPASENADAGEDGGITLDPDAGDAGGGVDAGDAGDGGAVDAGLTCAQQLGADYEEFETRCDGIDNDCSGAIDMSAPRAMLVGPGGVLVATFNFKLFETAAGGLIGTWGAPGTGDGGVIGAYVHNFDSALRLVGTEALPPSPLFARGYPELLDRTDGGYYVLDDVGRQYALWLVDASGALQGQRDAGYSSPPVVTGYEAFHLVGPDSTVFAIRQSGADTYVVDGLYLDGVESSQTVTVPGLTSRVSTVPFGEGDGGWGLPAVSDAGVVLVHVSWDGTLRGVDVLGAAPGSPTSPSSWRVERVFTPAEHIAIAMSDADGGRIVVVGQDGGQPWPEPFHSGTVGTFVFAGDRSALASVDLVGGERSAFVQFAGETRHYLPSPQDAGTPTTYRPVELTALRDGGLIATWVLDKPQTSAASRTVYGVRICR